jgi:cytoskeletal protein CcmA (bactofilin family)
MSKIDFQNVHTMIGAEAKIEGNISLEGGLIVYGKIQGDVSTKGPVRIAKTAEIVGNIIASDIQIGGIVNGNITVDDRIVLGDQSTVNGDMVYRRLYIEEGAKFSGRCDLTDE